ncbi:BnaC08g46680D [Brassica napus]|uniref:BnaC08g46680D protein n=1 Tax=Brassica napus TaxID=3708 RepID=A0A078JCK4_BRANA|nr:BnaC08g46680D [Brassica napus]
MDTAIDVELAKLWFVDAYRKD